MELFDFIKILFKKSNEKAWNNLSSYEKSKFQFMLNRFMSIKYPFNANQLNVVKTNGLGVAETWHSVARRFYGDSVPSFIYTKTSKNKKSDSPIAKIPKESIDIWCERHECGEREFNEILALDQDNVIEELKYITNNFREKEEKDERD
jgi:hypothetical protein